MNNKYDVSLTDNEKQQLVDNIKEIVNHLKGLVKSFGTTAKLNAEWTYYDRVWGRKTCRIEVEKDFMLENIGYAYHQTYALSLLDHWKEIKEDINTQILQRSETRNLIKEFEL